MRSSDIEAWALSIINNVRVGQPIENTRVELKSEWPDPKTSARQLAGHVNAASGDAILWLIGIDEKQGTIPGVNYTELAPWYRQVEAVFDELAPEPISIKVPSDGVTVAALFFETNRAPYVINNSEGGSIQREVPWRVSRETRSANRSQLLSLLAPIQTLDEHKRADAIRESRLQTYIDRVAEMLLEGVLGNSSSQRVNARLIVKTRTLLLFNLLAGDQERRDVAIKFLRDNDLLNSKDPIVTFHRADMSGFKLDAAPLAGIDFFAANFCNADLTDAVLEGCNLVAANFSKAILKRAVFKNAKISVADFRETDITADQIREAINYDKAHLPDQVAEELGLAPKPPS